MTAIMPSEQSTLPASEDSGLLLVGRCGRYEVLGPLGAGGMGMVVVAHDPALDRRVALKLLHPPTTRIVAPGAARIEREAQAMARLAHPNVVTVFEVDRVGDRTFVAMELVEGSTLRAWLAERPRPWREIIDMFVAAGHGLAAAHAAGLVHRDFKPDNVLIGRDGRPRVSDFGLVCEICSDPDELSETARPGIDVTSRGTAVGTPAYMSPEQWAGGPVDGRGDQFAFCVALWGALWRRAPFAGSTPRELRAAARAGALVEPSGGPRIPRRLHAALRRGLAVDPVARWPDMTALLDVLAHAAGRRRRSGVASATSAAIASAAIMVAASGRAAPEVCAAPTARLAGVWSPARRSVLAVKLAALDPAQGAIRFAKLAPVLDASARDWSAMHVEACLATRLEGRQSDTMLDRRMACLDHRLGELGDTVRVVEEARDRAALDRAGHAVTNLSPLEACADLRALGEALPPPADLVGRTTAAALGRRTRELDVELRVGRLDGLAAKISDLVAEARVLDHAPTLAAALAIQARDYVVAGHGSDAEAVLRELTQVAGRAHDDRLAAFAWTRLVMTLGLDKGKPHDASELVSAANAAVLRAGDPPDLRTDLLYRHATVLNDGVHSAEALALLTQARDMLEHAGASVPASRLADVEREIGAAHARLGNTDAAVASYRAAIARWQGLYGPDSLDEAYGWDDLGATMRGVGRLDEALAAYRTTARIREARLGESPVLVQSLQQIADVLDAQGRWDEAIAMLDRALRIDRTQLAPGDPMVATLENTRASTLVHAGRFDDAARDYDDAIAVFERAGTAHVSLAFTIANRGVLESVLGRCSDAMPDLARAEARLEQLYGPRAGLLVYPLVGEARCLMRAGRRTEALARLERATGLPTAGVERAQLALSRAWLGRARVETGRDVAGGLALARAARAGLAVDVNSAGDLRELDRWLAARGGRRIPTPARGTH